MAQRNFAFGGLHPVADENIFILCAIPNLERIQGVVALIWGQVTAWVGRNIGAIAFLRTQGRTLNQSIGHLQLVIGTEIVHLDIYFRNGNEYPRVVHEDFLAVANADPNTRIDYFLNVRCAIIGQYVAELFPN